MIETFFTALSEIKGKKLIDTLADRPEDVEIETLDETVSQRYAEVLFKNWLTSLKTWMLRQLMAQWQRRILSRWWTQANTLRGM